MIEIILILILHGKNPKLMLILRYGTNEKSNHERLILDLAHYSASVSDFSCVNMNSLPYPQRKILLLTYLEAILIFNVLSFSIDTSAATCRSFYLTNRSFLFLRSIAVVKTQRHAT